MNWNDTQPDGTVLTPAPGMLVARSDTGEWLLTDSIGYMFRGSESDEWLHLTLGDCPDMLCDDGVVNDIKDEYTPLAPAPTPGGLWAALEGMFPQRLYQTMIPSGGDMLMLKLTAGCLHVKRRDPARPYWQIRSGFPMNEEVISAHNIDAVTAELGNLRTLLAYCAQPGWEVQQ